MLWWIVAGVLVGAELFTGTVYLLVIALGAAAGAAAAHLGLSPTIQVTLATAVGVAGVTLWYLWCRRKKSAKATQASAMAAPNATLNKLDFGGVVLVQAWMPDGTSHVSYRGAVWNAIAADPATQPHPGRHVVVDIRNNQLVLQPENPHTETP